MNLSDLSLKPSRSRTIIFMVLLPKFSSIPIHETTVNEKYSLIDIPAKGPKRQLFTVE